MGVTTSKEKTKQQKNKSNGKREEQGRDSTREDQGTGKRRKVKVIDDLVVAAVLVVGSSLKDSQSKKELPREITLVVNEEEVTGLLIESDHNHQVHIYLAIKPSLNPHCQKYA